jgi:hypothetical protein
LSDLVGLAFADPSNLLQTYALQLIDDQGRRIFRLDVLFRDRQIGRRRGKDGEVGVRGSGRGCMARMLEDAKVDGLLVRLYSIGYGVIWLRIDPSNKIAL